MAEAIELRVEGLAEMVAGLRALDRELPKAVSRGLRELSKEAQRRAEQEALGLGGVHAGVVRRRGIGRFASTTKAGLTLRAAKVPFAMGAEFGSHQFRQFPPWRGNRWTDPEGSNVGYMIHPALRKFLPEATADYADLIIREIDDALDRLGVSS